MLDNRRKPLKILAAAIAVLSASVTTLPASIAYADDTAQLSYSNGLAQSSLALLPNAKAEAAREPIAIPGTSVSLSPPAGFVPSDQFSGLINPDNSSSIVVAELPAAAYSDLASLFASTPETITDAFAKRGIVLAVETVSSVSVGESQVPLIRGTQTVSGIEVGKYLVLLGGGSNEESTILLTFNIVEPGQLSEQTIIETVESVTIAPVLSTAQKVAELPFSFEAAGPFQVFDVLLGSAVLLSPNGEADPSGEAPIIVIASSVSPTLTGDLAAFSSQLLQNTEGFSEARITVRSPAEFAGGDGYFIEAALSDSTVLQYVRILPDNFYLRMLVVGDTQELADLSSAIESIQSSVAAKE